MPRALGQARRNRRSSPETVLVVERDRHGNLIPVTTGSERSDRGGRDVAIGLGMVVKSMMAELRQLRAGLNGRRNYKGALISSFVASLILILVVAWPLASLLTPVVLLPLIAGLLTISMLNAARRGSTGNLTVARQLWLTQLVIGVLTIIGIPVLVIVGQSSTGSLSSSQLIGSIVLVIPLSWLWQHQLTRYRQGQKDIGALTLGEVTADAADLDEDDAESIFKPLPAQVEPAPLSQSDQPVPQTGATPPVAAPEISAPQPAGQEEIVSKPLILQPDPAWANDTPELVITEVERFQGQEEASREMVRLIKSLPIRMRRQEKGYGTLGGFNYRFEGPPGTGKTTFAQFLSRALLAAGVVESGHVVVAKAKDLIAGYIGQSAHLTQSTIEQSRGGILLVDEAYKLRSGDPNSQDAAFKKDALDTLVEEMGQPDNRLTVIFCGYPDDIEALMKMNDGLTSRFSGGAVPFHRYEAEDLTQIAVNSFFPKADYRLTDDATERLGERFADLMTLPLTKSRVWGNAREAETICKGIAFEHQARLADLEHSGTVVSDEQLLEIEAVDVDQGFDSFIAKRQRKATANAEFQPLQVPTEPHGGFNGAS